MSSSTSTNALKTFFSTPNFAVAGASSDPRKYGHKVFTWYLAHSLPVTPLHPTSTSITALSSTHATLPSPSALPAPRETALSIITPPKITLAVLKEAREVGIKAVFMQPGSFDEEGLKFARGGFETVLAGDGGMGGVCWWMGRGGWGRRGGWRGESYKGEEGETDHVGSVLT